MFIVFEGLDGAGKSTLIESVFKALQKMQIDCLVTREPGGTKLGENIRNLVLDPSTKLSAKTELLLISAARRDHVEKLILPALKKNQWILCDRFWASTSAFQGKARALPMQQIKQMNAFSTQGIQPDLWFLLDISLQEKEKRSLRRGEVSDTFEMQDQHFHQKVREAYLELAQKDPKNWCILNAMHPVKKLTQLSLQEMKKRKWLR